MHPGWSPISPPGVFPEVTTMVGRGGTKKYGPKSFQEKGDGTSASESMPVKNKKGVNVNKEKQKNSKVKTTKQVDENKLIIDESPPAADLIEININADTTPSGKSDTNGSFGLNDTFSMDLASGVNQATVSDEYRQSVNDSNANVSSVTTEDGFDGSNENRTVSSNLEMVNPPVFINAANLTDDQNLNSENNFYVEFPGNINSDSSLANQVSSPLLQRSLSAQNLSGSNLVRGMVTSLNANQGSGTTVGTNARNKRLLFESSPESVDNNINPSKRNDFDALELERNNMSCEIQDIRNELTKICKEHSKEIDDYV